MELVASLYGDRARSPYREANRPSAVEMCGAVARHL